MTVIAVPPHLIIVDALAREEGLMPWIALAEAAVPKVSPSPVDILVSRSSARWRGPKHPFHFFHVYSMTGLPSHSRRSLGKELTERSECVGKAAWRSIEKGGPDSSDFLCVYSIALIYSRTQGSLVHKDGRLRRSAVTSARLNPLL